MTANEAHAAVIELVHRHCDQCIANFSPEVATCMIACLGNMSEALRYQCAERKDGRDIIITLSRMFSEADNAATLLAQTRADTILGEGAR